MSVAVAQEVTDPGAPLGAARPGLGSQAPAAAHPSPSHAGAGSVPGWGGMFPARKPPHRSQHVASTAGAGDTARW